MVADLPGRGGSIGLTGISYLCACTSYHCSSEGNSCGVQVDSSSV